MPSTHLSVLETSSSLYSDRPVFRTPSLDPSTNEVREWNIITYRQFQRDVDTYARYFASILSSIPQRSVIGLWYVVYFRSSFELD